MTKSIGRPSKQPERYEAILRMQRQHEFHALSLSELGDDAEAVKEAERAVELAPIDSIAHLNLAITAKRTNMQRAIAEAVAQSSSGRKIFQRTKC